MKRSTTHSTIFILFLKALKSNSCLLLYSIILYLTWWFVDLNTTSGVAPDLGAGGQELLGDPSSI